MGFRMNRKGLGYMAAVSASVTTGVVAGAQLSNTQTVSKQEVARLTNIESAARMFVTDDITEDELRAVLDANIKKEDK